MTEPFIVTSPEAGQKLLQFLSRRLDAPKALLHRWIRSGQIRVNGKRANPFSRLSCDDLVRIPPFATYDIKKNKTPYLSKDPATQKELTDLYPLPKIVAETNDLIVISKPAGLPTHGGSGHIDSVAYRLHLHYSFASFMPTPIHRIDKDTTGLLLIAKNYLSLRKFALSFARRSIQKEYLVWVSGLCPWDAPVYLEDALVLSSLNNKKHTLLCPTEKNATPSKSRQARLAAYCLKRQSNYSLLHIKLHTGRTHQIRAQLSARDHPVVGDQKYGSPRAKENFKLHSFRIAFNDDVYEDMPSWTGRWSINKASIPKDPFHD